MELVLSFTSCKLRNDIGGTTRTIDNLRSKARRFAYVASTSATSGELIGYRFSLGTFARDSSVRVNSVIAADVTGT